MGESREHINLVNTIVEYAKSIVPIEMRTLVQYDSADTKRPPKIGEKYIPDVFFWNRDRLIIGEAKTINDFDRKHSQEQFIAYLNECDSFSGQAMLIICLPWQLAPTAKNYFRRVKLEMDSATSIIILNELGKVSIV